MTEKALEDPNSKNLDLLKWLVVFLLLIAGLIANYHYNSQPWPLRLLGWLFLLAIEIGIASLTSQGKNALEFMKESRMELRKVFWPTRQEVIQTTLIVAAFVIILAILLWGVDSFLMWLIGWLTGQRG